MTAKPVESWLHGVLVENIFLDGSINLEISLPSMRQRKPVKI